MHVQDEAVPSATATFDYRYGLPILPVLPLAAALASRRWFERSRDGDAPPAEVPDELSRA